MYQNKAEGIFKFSDEKRSKSTSTYSLQPGLYTSNTEIVEAMKMLIQERNNHNQICITVKVHRITQKVVIMLATDTSSLVFCSTDLGHNFGNNVGNDFEVLMIGKGPQEREFAYDIVRIHSLMIYSNLVEQNLVGDTKDPLLRCFPFISKLKGGDIITTGQCMNYQTFSNLQFRPLLKNSLHSIHIWETHLVKKYPLYLSVSLALFWCLEWCPTFISNTYGSTRWLLQEKEKFHTIEGLEDRGKGDLGLSHKLLGELQFHFCVNISSQRQNA